MTLDRVSIPSPFYSSRGGASVRLICVHTAEGATTIESLGSWFQNPSAQCSSHTGADDTPNTVGEYVARPDKAWTQANYNPVAISIELCGFAAWSVEEWHRHPNMLANCAQWIAEEAAHFGIPIKRLSASEAQGSGRGVCQHVDLGAGGGGHHDCGSGFPIDEVLDMARGGGQIAPTPTPPTEENQVAIAATVADNGTMHVFVEAEDGSVWYCYQRKGETAWSGGKPGVAPAGLALLAPAPKK